MKQLPFLLIVLFSFNDAGAQLTVEPLKIGEKIPDFELIDALSDTARIRLSDYQGKFLLLDFWATWCTACTGGFPKLQKIQDKFNEKLQIVLVHTDNGVESQIKAPDYPDETNKIRAFLNSKPFYRDTLNLPVAFDIGNVLRKRFPFRYIPHYVWIDPKGRVISISGPVTVNEQTIDGLIKYYDEKKL